MNKWKELKKDIVIKSYSNEIIRLGECLQEQLKEANDVIKNMKLCMDDKYDYDCVAEDVDIYLEKWGVK